MMKKTYYIFLLGLILILSGCATAPYNGYVYDTWSYQNFYNNYRVEIISNPPGAKIELNNNYIGDAPLTFTINSYQGGINIIKANPIYSGQYVQTKIIPFNQVFPRRIYFDMSLAPVSNQININVNN